MNKRVEVLAILSKDCANLMVQNIPQFTATLNRVKA
jgi:hypothetical protein